MRLLFLESDPDVCRWLMAQADDLDVELELAADEVEALAVLSRMLVDAVVVDVASSACVSSLAWFQLCRRLVALDLPLLTYAVGRRLHGQGVRLGLPWGVFLPRPFTLEQVVGHVRHASGAEYLDLLPHGNVEAGGLLSQLGSA